MLFTFLYVCLLKCLLFGGNDMATITTKYDDAGKPISYKFTCCVGRDDNGKQVWRTKTVKSPHYTEAKEKKWINTELLNWEQQQMDD